MTQQRIIQIGVLTYIMLGLFNWMQHGVLLFSYPLVPAIILVMYIISWLVERPMINFQNFSVGLFVLVHFIFSPFFLEVILPYEKQLAWTLNGTIQYGQLVGYLFLILAAHSTIVPKGKRILNITFGLLLTATVFVYMQYASIPVSQMLIAGVGLLGGVLGLLWNKKLYSFSVYILLGIGVLYFVSSFNWISI